MTVEITHPDYDEHSEQWKRLSDVLSGLDAIIRGKTDYLPVLAGQAGNPQAYSAYQKRAVWYGATARTLEALVGAIFRRDPKVEVSPRLLPRMQNFDGRGNTSYTFAHKAVRNVIGKGRYGILVDMPVRPDLLNQSTLVPFFAGYSAESIRCWRVREIMSVPKLDQVILEERVQLPAEDGFGFTVSSRYRVLELDDNGLYQIRLFTRATSDSELVEQPTIYPTPTGNRIDYIPFIFLNPGDLMPDVSKSPLLDLADVNLAMFRASADLENGRHYTAHCTPWITGLNENNKRTWKIGGDSVWQLPEGCQVGMLEYTGQGLQSLENGVAEKRELMAFLGARLLRDQKRAAETAEAQEIQQSGENATLSSISRTVSDGFERALNIAEEWVLSRKKATFVLNTDFISRRMEPAELTALFTVMQGGGMPIDDFLWNLHEHEMLDPARTIEQARDLLELDAARAAEMSPDSVQQKPAATAPEPEQQSRNPGEPVERPANRTT